MLVPLQEPLVPLGCAMQAPAAVGSSRSSGQVAGAGAGQRPAVFQDKRGLVTRALRVNVPHIVPAEVWRCLLGEGAHLDAATHKAVHVAVQLEVQVDGVTQGGSSVEVTLGIYWVTVGWQCRLSKQMGSRHAGRLVTGWSVQLGAAASTATQAPRLVLHLATPTSEQHAELVGKWGEAALASYTPTVRCAPGTFTNLTLKSVLQLMHPTVAARLLCAPPQLGAQLTITLKRQMHHRMPQPCRYCLPHPQPLNCS